MAMSGRIHGVAPPVAGERGVIMVVVLILAVTFSALSLALLSTAEMSLRVQSNGRDTERAERAAQSGVEWAAAAVKSAAAIVDGTRSTILEPGVVVGATVRSATAPQLLGSGNAYGVAAGYAADAAILPGTFPHALLSFASQCSISDQLFVDGSAYFGEPTAPLALSAVRPLTIAGDLELVATIDPGRVVHSSGTTKLGMTALAEPVWSTLRYTLPTFWTVPYTAYTGATTISNKTLTGIVVVSAGAGQKLVLDNVRISGTLVVPWVYPPALELLGLPTIEVSGTLTIDGGTAETGNLAILAPGAIFKMDSKATADVAGVSYLRQIDGGDGATFRGQLLLRKDLKSTGSGALHVTRPVGFVPTVPQGIVWNGASRVQIDWKGKQ